MATFGSRARALLAAAVAVASACAGGATPRGARPLVPPPAPTVPPPPVVAKREPRPTPTPPTDEFPYVGIFNGYVQAFREEQIDDEWVKPTEATLRSQLTELDPNVVRVPLVECRCGLCMLGYIIAPAGEGRNPQPGVDLPAVRWSGYEKHMRGMRADGWAEGLAFLGRHPKDSPSSSPRVRSTDSPWNDPGCAGARPFPPTWEGISRSNWSGIGINRMYLPEKGCPCLCGKLNSDARPGCWFQSGGFVFCGELSFTDRGIPKIAGDWSCQSSSPAPPK